MLDVPNIEREIRGEMHRIDLRLTRLETRMEDKLDMVLSKISSIDAMMDKDRGKLDVLDKGFTAAQSSRKWTAVVGGSILTLIGTIALVYQSVMSGRP